MDIVTTTVVLIGALAFAGGGVALLIRRNGALRKEILDLRKHVEELSDRQWELREAEERMKSLLEAQGDLIVRRDDQGRIAYANDAYCALAGQPRDMLVGHRFPLPILEQGVVQLLADGTRVHDQKIDAPGGPRWISWHEVSVRSDSEPATHIQSVGRDVTARALAERELAEARDQATAANLAKSRFLAMVSHEIRTPLNGILGMADLLHDTTLSAEQASYVGAVQASGQTLLTLIEEILDFSKIEAGKLDLDPKPFVLEELVESIIELLAPRAQAKEIAIAAYVDPRLPPRVIGDSARLRQVLFNLAGNAVKFTEHGGVMIIAEPGAASGQVNIFVRDTGIGISPNAQARIFEEFEQADTGAARKYGGTGLGLAISKRIVDRMGGELRLDSDSQRGSTFVLSLPLAADEAVVELPAAPHLDDVSVLIVAPQRIEAELMSRRLNDWGAQTFLVADVDDALLEVSMRRWGTVIVDNAMGIAAASKIAEACKSRATPCVVMVTPQTRGDLAALKNAGFTGYLVKPVRAASLAARFDGRRDEPIDLAEARPLTGRSARSLSILVAEDNDINALLARTLLMRLGHAPTMVADGAQAVAAFKDTQTEGKPFDLILMDVHMPQVDGITATGQIRELENATGQTPVRIVALTANASMEDRVACLSAGMNGFLTKPFDRELFIAAISASADSNLAA
jgi:PAS domain S-box-containing protein